MKIFKTIGLALGVLGLNVAVVGQAEAVPMIFGSNAYELILVSDPFSGANNTWATANAAANASVFMTKAGHLATVTSQAENDFLVSLIPGVVPLSNPPGFSGAWLGGRAGTGWLAGSENGNAFTYTNFGGGEPNDNGFAYLEIARATPTSGALPLVGEWLDDSGVQGTPTALQDPVIGYFVEYENVSVVPVPAALPLFAGGLGLLGLLGWRRKRMAAA